MKEPTGDGAVGLGDIGHFLKVNVRVFCPLPDAKGHRRHGGQAQGTGVEIREEPLHHQRFKGGWDKAGAPTLALKSLRRHDNQLGALRLSPVP